MGATGKSLVRSEAEIILTEGLVAGGMAELRWELRDLVLAGVRNLIVDVSRIDRLSSTTLAALLSTHRACRARGGGVIIRNPNAKALDLLRRTGLHRVFLVDPPLS
jgi:anti-anti-sigma factor